MESSAWLIHCKDKDDEAAKRNSKVLDDNLLTNDLRGIVNGIDYKDYDLIGIINE